jgi:hypothetical protein
MNYSASSRMLPRTQYAALIIKTISSARARTSQRAQSQLLSQPLQYEILSVYWFLYRL